MGSPATAKGPIAGTGAKMWGERQPAGLPGAGPALSERAGASLSLGSSYSARPPQRIAAAAAKSPA